MNEDKNATNSNESVQNPAQEVIDVTLPTEVSTIVPAPVVQEKERDIGYVINDKYFKGFEVVKTDNAWWKERRKVEEFIECLKQSYTIKQACIFIGISDDQYFYFAKIHPKFSELKRILKEVAENIGIMMGRTNIHTALRDKDMNTTKWFMERKVPEEFGRYLIEGGSPVNNNFGVINNIKIEKESLPEDVLAKLKERRNGGG